MSSPRQSPLETQLSSRTSSRPRPLAPNHIEIPPPALLQSRDPSRRVESPHSGSLPELSLSSRRSSPESLDSVPSGYEFEVIEASRSLPDLPEQIRQVEEIQIPARPVLSRSGSLFFEDLSDGIEPGRRMEVGGGIGTRGRASPVPGSSTSGKGSLPPTPRDTSYNSRNAPSGDVFDGLYQLPQLSTCTAPKVPYFLAYPPARHSSVAVPSPVSPHPRDDHFQSFPLPPMLQSPSKSPLARTRTGGKGPIPFVMAPTPPPEAPLPHPPSFVSIFVDPVTNSVPPIPTTPRRSDHRTSSSLALSPPSPTKSRAPRTDKPVERKSSLTKNMESMRRAFVGDWMRKDAPKTDADLPLSDLVARAEVVEQQLIGTGIESDAEGGSQLRSRRNTSLGSKWSFGATGSQFVDVDREEGWSRIKDEGAERARKAARREKKAGVDRRSRDRKIGEAKSKTEAWLKGVPMTPTSVSSWSRLLPRRGSSPEESTGRTSSRIWIVVLVLVGLTIAAGLAAYFATRPKTILPSGPSAVEGCVCENGGIASVLDGVCACRCDVGWGGSFCNFNSTCTTTLRSGRLQIAQGIVDVATHANTVFSPSIDTSRLAVVLHSYLGLPSSTSQSDCAPQLSLITLPNLPPSNFTNRLAFISAAVLWTTAMSESNTSSLLTFVSSLSFAALGDRPSTKPDSNYQIIKSGYAFDFSTMTVFLPSVSWISAASPVSSQIALVNPQPHVALDRMTGYASAASSQRTTALVHYWAELNLSSTSLTAFKSALQNAPVVVPFNADDGTMVSAGNQGTGSFPPAISCEGGLRAGQVSYVNSVETGVFGLPSISATSAPDDACLDRPLYGLLNILSLRLPFPPSSPLSTQGLIVSSINKDRMTLHAGETLVARSDLVDPTTPSSPILPERYGTLERFDHVILEYLRLMTPALARAIISFVLDQSPSNPTPPTTTSEVYLLSQGFSILPMMEVQIWGGLRRSNIDHVVSSLSTTSQSMFFGSSLGVQLRTWALGGNASIPIRWTLDALQEKVVMDLSLSTSTSFGSIWLGVSNTSSTSPTSVWNQLVVAELLSPG